MNIFTLKNTCFLCFVDKVTTIGLHAYDGSNEERKKIRIVNFIAFYALVAVIGFCVINVVQGFPEILYIDAIIALAAIITLFLNHRRKFNLARKFLFLSIPAIFLLFPLFVGEVGTQFYYFMFIAIGLYAFDEKRDIFVFTTYCIILYIIALLTARGITHPAQYHVLEPLNYYPSLFASMLIIMVVSIMFKIDTARNQQSIQDQKMQLERKVVELDEKNTIAINLLKELNHRVKNNLQLISSLFILQAYKTTDLTVKQALDEARNRIDTVAILHQRLYKDSMVLESNLKQYIEKLSTYVVQSSCNDNPVDLDTFVSDISLRVEDSLHVGLIINELLTNAIKYGSHKHATSNKITLRIVHDNKQISILVKDSGAGFPPGFASEHRTSLGLELVESIVMQHEGTINYTNEQGGVVSVVLNIL